MNSMLDMSKGQLRIDELAGDYHLVELHRLPLAFDWMTRRMKVSLLLPFLVDTALNWNMLPVFFGK
jgi:hypothetical protein